MSLDKAIAHKKEHRKPFYKGKAISLSCRNHKSCPQCQGNRMHSNEKKIISSKEQMNAIKSPTIDL